MKTAVTALCLMLAAAPAIAQDQLKDGAAGAPAAKQRATKPASEKQSARKPLTEKQQRQQAKFRDCSQQAKGRKGDDRKQFMKQCLSQS